MRKSILNVCLLISLSSITEVIYADEFDQILHALEQIEGYTSGTEVATQAINSLNEQEFQALAAHFGYGDLLNSDEDLSARKWSPDTWESALQGLSGGNDARYKQLVDDYQKNHPYLSNEDMQKGASSANTTNYEQQVETNRAAMAHASYSFESVNEHLDNIKELSSQINKAENPKAIEEINARINAEVAYLQVEQIKSMAIMNEQLAQSQASELVHEKAASEFNQVPEK